MRDRERRWATARRPGRSSWRSASRPPRRARRARPSDAPGGPRPPSCSHRLRGRVFGVVRGVVAGGEPVRGLPPGGLRYDAEFELLRRAAGRAPRPRMLLVEAENRGSPLLLGALTAFEPSVTGAPSTARHPAATGRVLRRLRVAGTRGFSGGRPRRRRAGDRAGRGPSPCATWGARSDAASPGGRSAEGFSQAEFFSSTPSWPRASTPCPPAPGPRPGNHGGPKRELDGHQPPGNRIRAPAGPIPARGRTPAPLLRPLRRPAEAPAPRQHRQPQPTSTSCAPGSPTVLGARRAGACATTRPSPHRELPPPAVRLRRGCASTAASPCRSTRCATSPTLRALVDGLAPRPPTRRARGASASASSRRPGRPSKACPRRRGPGAAHRRRRPAAGQRPLPRRTASPSGACRALALAPAVTTSSGGGVYRNSRQLAPRSRPAVVAAGWVPRAVAVAGFDRALRRLRVSERYLLAADQPALLARAGSPRRKRLAGVDPALTNRNTGSWVECVTSRAHRELSAQEQRCPCRPPLTSPRAPGASSSQGARSPSRHTCGDDQAYVADLLEEILATHHAPCGSAVIEIARPPPFLTAELHSYSSLTHPRRPGRRPRRLGPSRAPEREKQTEARP